MCAINPAHKKRLILDVYTSNQEISQKEFENLVAEKAFQAELTLNQDPRLRWHVKETKQEAD